MQIQIWKLKLNAYNNCHLANMIIKCIRSTHISENIKSCSDTVDNDLKYTRHNYYTYCLTHTNISTCMPIDSYPIDTLNHALFGWKSHVFLKNTFLNKVFMINDMNIVFMI